MKIRFINRDDLSACARLFTRVMNSPPWNEQWTLACAEAYLCELATASRFVGFVMLDETRLIGAAFCHEKTWWSGGQLVIDDIFMEPASQGGGHGTQLIGQIENYAAGVGMGGITLLTDKNIPAHDFYLKNGFADAARMTFMFKWLNDLPAGNGVGKSSTKE